jgi:hypothetical protein
MSARTLNLSFSAEANVPPGTLSAAAVANKEPKSGSAEKK